ncbi:MAG: hypothetical protein KDJ62_06550, partial [Rhodobiaceae bacterium]|nr:hypothetical protein [Rhodobiaceae bacterium]
MAKSTKKKELPSIEDALKPFMEDGKPSGMSEAPQAAFTAEARVDSGIGKKILKSRGAASKAARPERAPRIDGTEGMDLMDPSTAPAQPKGKGRIPDDGSASLPAQKNIEALLARGRPFYVSDDAPEWVPHRPERPEKTEGGIAFNLQAEYEPKGDQPTAIAELVEGIGQQEHNQVLLGVTG